MCKKESIFQCVIYHQQYKPKIKIIQNALAKSSQNSNQTIATKCEYIFLLFNIQGLEEEKISEENGRVSSGNY